MDKSTVVPLGKLQLLTEVCYRVANCVRAPPIAKLEASIKRSKGLQRSSKTKTGAEQIITSVFQRPVSDLYPKSMVFVTAITWI